MSRRTTGLLTGLLATSLLPLGACSSPEAELLEVESSLMDEAFALQVLLPPSFAADSSLPVVYLIDGYYHFAGLSAHVQRGWDAGELEDFILVGVGYAGFDDSVASLLEIEDKRLADLPWPEDEGLGGGGQRFHEALTTELLPALEQAYAPTPSGRTLMGHSLGGHFALLDMLTFSPDDSAFDTIVAASPSIWWAEASLLQDERALSETHDDLDFRLIIGVGTLEGISMNATTELMIQELEGRGYPSLELSSHFPKAGHMEAAERIFEAAVEELF